jgi:S1-C subfamily serine protease
MRNIIGFFVIGLLFVSSAYSQTNGTKLYFDKSGKSTNETSSYYYRTLTDKPDYYKSYFSTDNTLYFEGTIKKADNLNENNNVFSGTCTWYYKNGQKKMTKIYNETGIENGISYYYFESGRISKEIEYKNGKILNNKFKEYTEDGEASRIFEENFTDNSSDWDTYSSDISKCILNFKSLEITSLTKDGTSRFISAPIESNNYIIEATFDNSRTNASSKVGIIWGFKDWQNYNYFVITGSYFYAGTVYEGINTNDLDGMYTSDLKAKGINILKIFSDGDKTFFTINGIVQNKLEEVRIFGNKLGFALSGKSTLIVNKLVLKEIDFKNKNSVSNVDMDVKAIGTGIIFNSKGYIVTNYHVVENSKKIIIEQTINGEIKQFNATIVQKDIDNDLAILKMEGDSLNIQPISYTFKENGMIDVGTSVFTVGYPYALSGMGKEIKFTDGKISAKTGYNNAVNSFQTSIPVQPGNSGGPVFNDKGQLVGLINAKISGADNVSYAIKLNYIKNLIEILPEQIEMPNNQSILNLNLEDKIKTISNFVVLIKIK